MIPFVLCEYEIDPHNCTGNAISALKRKLKFESVYQSL